MDISTNKQKRDEFLKRIRVEVPIKQQRQNGTSGTNNNSSEDDYKEERILSLQTGRSYGMSLRTDFSEQGLSEAKKEYDHVVETICNRCQNLTSQLENRLKEHPYLQSLNHVNTLIYFYNVRVPGRIQYVLQKWFQSDHCFVALVKKQRGADQKTIDQAQRLQRLMYESIKEHFGQLSYARADYPESTDESYMEEDRKFIVDKLNDMKSDKDVARRHFEVLAQERNTLYAHMSIMVMNTYQFVIDVYEAAESDLETLKREYMENTKLSMEQAFEVTSKVQGDSRTKGDYSGFRFGMGHER